jgi:hypothetical protein
MTTSRQVTAICLLILIRNGIILDDACLLNYRYSLYDNLILYNFVENGIL